ncbi:hypothetical protein DAI22_03g136200 [Oryza sativa Japonica Group]|nr:hypothetical protein DAI22_03g136200 [Oryza sativa Japonica Group]
MITHSALSSLSLSLSHTHTPLSRPLFFSCAGSERVGDMDGGQDHDERKKSHGNPYPRRGDIKRKIVQDVFGKSSDPPATSKPAGAGNGDGGDDAAAAGSYYGHY